MVDFRYWRAYGKLFQDLIEDEYDVRALVLASSLSKMFTAGLDREYHTLHCHFNSPYPILQF